LISQLIVVIHDKLVIAFHSWRNAQSINQSINRSIDHSIADNQTFKTITCCNVYSAYPSCRVMILSILLDFKNLVKTLLILLVIMQKLS